MQTLRFAATCCCCVDLHATVPYSSIFITWQITWHTGAWAWPITQPGVLASGRCVDKWVAVSHSPSWSSWPSETCRCGRERMPSGVCGQVPPDRRPPTGARESVLSDTCPTLPPGNKRLMFDWFFPEHLSVTDCCEKCIAMYVLFAKTTNAYESVNLFHPLLFHPSPLFPSPPFPSRPRPTFPPFPLLRTRPPKSSQ